MMQKNLRDVRTNEHGKLEIYSLCFYILLLPVATGLSGLIGDISFLNYIAIFYIIETYINRRMRLSFKKEFTFLYAYMGYTIVSIIWSGQYEISWYITTFMLNAFIVLLAASREYSDLEKQYIRNAVYISALFVIFVALLNLSTAKNFRLVITLTSKMDPNDFGCGLCFILAYLLNDVKKHRKWFPCLCIFALLAIILFTGSRGAMLMAAAVVFVWGLYLLKSGQWKSVLKVGIVAFIILSFVYAMLPDYLKSRLEIGALLADGGSGRGKIWEQALLTFSRSDSLHQLFGYGHGSFQTVVNYKMPSGHLYQAHNMFINALIEGGVIGLVLLIFAFGAALCHAAKTKNLIAFLAIVGFAVEGISLDAQVYRIFPIVFLSQAFFTERSAGLKGRSFKNSFKVSIIIPVYNVQAYLRECLDSVCQQTFGNLEIILIDDGSTDESGLICDEYAQKDKRIIVVHKSNGGQSSARNLGIQMAKGEYVAFIDSDDCIALDTIERLGETIVGCDIAACGFTENFQKLQVGSIAEKEIFSSEEALSLLFREKVFMAAPWKKLFKRDLLKGIVFPEGKIYEDYGTTYKWFDRAHKISFINEKKYYYRYNPTSTTKKGFNPKRLDYYDITEDILQFMKKQYPKFVKYVRRHMVRNTIAFFREMVSCDYYDDEVETKFRTIIKEGIWDYLFSGYKLLSKAYGLCILISPKLARKIFKR
ncbi:MAG: glycosyltransferase [Clostridia bacterium]|nr:glycosyltransferase [Clostridia bacterium]